MANGWTKLYGHTVTSGEAGTSTILDTGTISGTWDSLKIVIDVVQHSSDECVPSIYFNDDRVQQYPIKRNSDFSDGSTSNDSGFSTTYYANYAGYGGDAKRLCIYDIANHAGHEKLITCQQIISGSSPYMNFGCGKYCGSSGNPALAITKVHIASFNINDGSSTGTQYFGEGTKVTVFGAGDGTTTNYYPNLPKGTIFEEQDTGKHYMFDGTSAWNEV